MTIRTRGPSTQRQDTEKRVRLMSRTGTAVAAERGKSDRSGTYLREELQTGESLRHPPGMDVFAEEVQTDLRRGVKRKGTVEWPALEQMADNACVSNLLISHVLVGEVCEVEQLAKWCNESTEHIVVVTLTKNAVSAGSDMQKCFRQATVKSVHQALLQHGGYKDKIKIIEKATAERGSKLTTAVAAAETAVAAKFGARPQSRPS